MTTDLPDLPPMTDEEREAVEARIATRREATEAADQSLNSTMAQLGRKLVHAQRRGRATVTDPISEGTARENAPTLFYGRDGRWSALGEIKPRGHRFRLLRGHGRTARAALTDLDRQIDRVTRGERDGEQ